MEWQTKLLQRSMELRAILKHDHHAEMYLKSHDIEGAERIIRIIESNAAAMRAIIEEEKLKRKNELIS